MLRTAGAVLRAAKTEPAIVARRAMATRIPVGARPQLLVSATGRHRPSATRDMTELIFKHGASLAGTKKVLLEKHFTMMMSVWVPPDGSDPASLRSELQSETVAAQLGFPLQVELLVDGEQVPPQMPLKRRFKLTCPQKPGIVLAVTELLRDHGCAISEIDATTMETGGEIWFELECIVELPSEAAADAVDALEEGLRFWTSSSDTRSKLIFSQHLNPDIQPLSHA